MAHIIINKGSFQDNELWIHLLTGLSSQMCAKFDCDTSIPVSAAKM